MKTLPLIRASRDLARKASALRFVPPVRHVYNPLLYARAPAEAYLARFGRGRVDTVFLGMNPGPWGMAQTGVPFGEVDAVRDWLGISGRVSEPPGMHPRVPVRGFDCARSEVSGRRLWGLMRQQFGSAGEFGKTSFVANYCPLLFLDQAGRNLTPDKISKPDREALYAVCDRFLVRLLESLQPRWLVAVGGFASRRLSATAVTGRIIRIPHPSPASPLANRGWAEAARAILVREGVWQAQGKESLTRTPT